MSQSKELLWKTGQINATPAQPLTPSQIRAGMIVLDSQLGNMAVTLPRIVPHPPGSAPTLNGAEVIFKHQGGGLGNTASVTPDANDEIEDAGAGVAKVMAVENDFVHIIADASLSVWHIV